MLYILKIYIQRRCHASKSNHIMPTATKTQTGSPNSSQPTSNQPPKLTFNTLTIAEALIRPKTEFLVQNYIAENSINFIVGAPGSAKTFFALDLAIEMMRPTLGTMADEWAILKPLNVLFMTDEGIDEIASNDGRLISLLDHKGLYDKSANTIHACTDNLLLITDMLNLFQDVDIKKQRYRDFLTQFLAFQPDVIFIDTYANAVIGSEENSNKEVNKIGMHMRQLKGDLSCALFLLHHTAKGMAVSKGNPYIGRGAGSLGGFSDCIIGLASDPDNEDCSFMHHCKAKHGRLQPSRIMTRVSSPDYYYPYLTYEPYSNKTQTQVQQKRNDITDALAQYGEMDAGKLSQATGIPRSSIDRRLNDLVKDGKIKRFKQDATKPVGRGNPFIYDNIQSWP